MGSETMTVTHSSRAMQLLSLASERLQRGEISGARGAIAAATGHIVLTREGSDTYLARAERAEARVNDLLSLCGRFAQYVDSYHDYPHNHDHDCAICVDVTEAYREV